MKLLGIIITVIGLLYLASCIIGIGWKDFISMCKNEKEYAALLALIMVGGILWCLNSWKVMLE